MTDLDREVNIKTIVNDDPSILDECNKKLYEIAAKVYSKLGVGHTEFIYHRAMEIELRNNNYCFETEKRIVITYVDDNDVLYTLGEERIDLYIHDKNCPTIIELKSVIKTSTTPKENEVSQVYKYYRELPNTKYGIIINFPQSGAKQSKNTIDFCQIKLF